MRRASRRSTLDHPAAPTTDRVDRPPRPTTAAPTTARPTTAGRRPGGGAATPTPRAAYHAEPKPKPAPKPAPEAGAEADAQRRSRRPAPSTCDPNYTGQCLKDGIGDYDCSSGSGNGPNYVYGTVRVVGSDPFGLDRDNDGLGCEDG